MAFKDIPITKKKVLSFYPGRTPRDKCIALARELGVHPNNVVQWREGEIPRPWAIIIANLVHPDKFTDN